MLIDMVTLFKAKNNDDFVRFQVLTAASMIRYDDGGSTHLWNVGRQLFYTEVHPRRQFWTKTIFILQAFEAYAFPPQYLFTCFWNPNFDTVSGHRHLHFATNDRPSFRPYSYHVRSR
jgi:hypothetical protein